MRLVILGGTVFLGRHLVESALARGHEVTMFNRGKHNADLFPEVEKLRGDRDGDLSALEGRRWDAVIDTCGYVPRVVRASAELLSGAVDHYTFISSISVYSDWSKPGMDESGPIGMLDDVSLEEVTGETYGPLKALCEQAAEASMPGRVLNIRPGLIVGPYDPSDRFTYWPLRVAHGGELLAPGSPNGLTQIIDVRDLAEWTIRMVEVGKTGVYNATGPDYPLTMGRLMEECRNVSGSDGHITWVDEKFLLDAQIAPWSELPLWVPASEGAGLACRKAMDDGLVFRPLADTIQDTLAWAQTLPADRELRAGMKPEREAEALRSWHNRGR